jgi:hypothetical protein
MFFILFSIVSIDCPIYTNASALCKIPLTLTWGGFAFIFIKYTIPLALGLYFVALLVRKFYQKS